jgi:hypothetical protein
MGSIYRRGRTYWIGYRDGDGWKYESSLVVCQPKLNESFL